MRHPCIECGALTHRPQRCGTCPPRYTYAEQQRMRAAVARHRETIGDYCPMCDTQTSDLTADHITPRVMGGHGGPLRVICRSCNSKLGAQLQ